MTNSVRVIPRFSPEHARRDPITGEPKKEHDESIVSFAERHGWTVKSWENESMGLQENYRFTKDQHQIDVCLWTKTTPESFVSARSDWIDIPDPIRVRVERAIVGVTCICDRWEGVYQLEYRVDPGCQVHGS